MIKLTKRKGFNFFRSYYDVYNELSDKDKVAFMDALLDRQFLGTKPEGLKGMAKFAYISQTNSIDGQVKGWEEKTGNNLTPNDGADDTPCQGGLDTPTEQEKGKGKGKLQEKEKGGLVFPFEIEKEWNLWKDYKKEQHGFRYKSKVSEQAALKKLGDLAGSKEDAITIIHQSIENGWKGFFELKKNGNGKQRLSADQQQYLVSRKDC